jgi:hypothetical protein
MNDLCEPSRPSVFAVKFYNFLAARVQIMVQVLPGKS